VLIGQGKRLAKGERRFSSKTWRLLNEVPFILAIPIVILVILKPF
jgi:putative membrane protein